MEQNVKQKYDKYKRVVKKWEKNFKQKQGRIPSKYDIREAPKEIRDSYKMYYKLKTSFLEDTLGDVLSEDGFDILENSQSEFNFSTNDNNDSFFSQNNSEIQVNVSNLVIENNNSTCSIEESENKSGNNEIKKKSENIKEFEPIEILDINQRAWLTTDSNQKKKDTATTTSKDVEQKTQNKSSLLKTLKTKLLSSTSFTKRNPRKSLSRSQSNLSNSSRMNSQEILSQSSSQEILPDLEAILLAKSQDKSKETVSVNTSLNVNTKIPNKVVDEGWLNRCTTDNKIFTTCVSSDNKQKDADKINNFGISNIFLKNKTTEVEIKQNESQINTKFDNDSDSVISNSEDESTSRFSQIRHIRKKRRLSESTDNTVKKLIDVKKPLIEDSNKTQSEDDKSKKLQNDKKTEKIEKSNKTKIRQKLQTTNRKSQRNKKMNVSYRETSVSPSKDSDELNKDEKNSNKKKSQKLRKSTMGRKKELEENELNYLNSTSDLNYNLDFGDGILTSMPRINIEDINRAEEIVGEYVKGGNQKQNSASIVTNDKNSLAIEMKKKKLEKKIAAGKLNENFVRIDLKKKIFVRGKRNTNFSRYKKKLWKQKKAANALCGPDMDMRGCDGGIVTCFTCGQPGHFAKNCTVKGDTLLPLDADMKDDDDSLFPTLKEAEEMAANQATTVHSRNIESMPDVANELIYKDVQDNETDTSANVDETQAKKAKEYIRHQIPEDILRQCGLLDDGIGNQIESLYSLNADGSTKPIPSEVYDTLHMFGHKNFRKGQDKAVMRVLSGLSTLVTLSTGSGKSLCYQLPAYLYSRKKKCLTLVVSPLVSLMEDQVHGVPHFLRAHCLHTNQTPQQKEKVLEIINKGEIDILLVSPEAVVAGEKSSSGFGGILRKLPPIAFACIDEAHCVSQWSHNFRPSYLMICKVLREKLKIRTILGLTATATLATKESIIRHLSIPDGENGVVSDIPLPDNLILSVSRDSNRDGALIELLKSERFASCQSIIIYCTRRDECERIAGFIRTFFQDKTSETNKRRRINWYAEAYHAGMTSSRRRTIQNAFMRNELRVIVATIAFGMGINKSDIRAIIHYNMPKTYESYVQEVGRAGRDGNISHCHLFLDSNGLDRNELKRHIYANSFDRYVIRKLLQKIFLQCSCNKNSKLRNFTSKYKDIELSASQNIQLSNKENLQIEKRICPGHEIGFSIEKTVQELDIPEENISTLLYYLELDGRWNLNVLSNAYVMCKIISYGGPKYLKQAAKECPPLAMAIAIQIKNKTFDYDANIIEFPVIEMSSAIGWNSGIVKYQLKNLEWTTIGGLPKRSCISVSFFDLGFRVKAPGDLTDDELDEALDALYNRSVQQEKTQLVQLQCVYNGLESLAFNSITSCSNNNFPIDRSNKLKHLIRDYFQNELPSDIEISETSDTTSDDEIISDVLSMINMYPENQFTGRTLARIFHGIQSPNYSAPMWSRCKYWRSHSKTDFNRIIKLANSVILKMRN